MTAQLDRAEASIRYGIHLIDSALTTVDRPPSRPRAIGLMGCEHLRLALVGLAPERTRQVEAA